MKTRIGLVTFGLVAALTVCPGPSTAGIREGLAIRRYIDEQQRAEEDLALRRQALELQRHIVERQRQGQQQCSLQTVFVNNKMVSCTVCVTNGNYLTTCTE